MDNNQFMDRFVADEGNWALDALELAQADEAGVREVDYNVWILHMDASDNTLRFEHDFTPDEGSMPLDEFVAGLQARLPPR